MVTFTDLMTSRESFKLYFRIEMAFKLPLLRTRKTSTHQRTHTEFGGIPNFTKREFSDVQMIGQGTFGTVFKASKDYKTFVIKVLKASDTTAEDIKLFKK